MSALGTTAFGLDQTPDLSSEIAGEVLLHDGSRLGIGAEILLQCPNLPTHGAQRLNCHRLHVGLECR